MPQVTIAEAAQLLGLSKVAVRSRIRRGTLEAAKNSRDVWLVTVSEHTPTAIPTHASASIPTTIPAHAPTSVQGEPHSGNEAITALAAALAAMEKQLVEKDAQIVAANDQLQARSREVHELHMLLADSRRALSATSVMPLSATEHEGLAQENTIPSASRTVPQSSAQMHSRTSWRDRLAAWMRG